MAYVIGNDCIACGTCIDECPVEAISEGDIYKSVVLVHQFVLTRQLVFQSKDTTVTD